MSVVWEVNTQKPNRFECKEMKNKQSTQRYSQSFLSCLHRTREQEVNSSANSQKETFSGKSPLISQSKYFDLEENKSWNEYKIDHHIKMLLKSTTLINCTYMVVKVFKTWVRSMRKNAPFYAKAIIVYTILLFIIKLLFLCFVLLLLRTLEWEE